MAGSGIVVCGFAMNGCAMGDVGGVGTSGGALSARGFSAETYWERRYASGGSSGAGSYGRLARYKAAFLNGFMARNGVSGVVDFGCGDGHLLTLLAPPDYLGVDVSATALARCAARVAGRPGFRFAPFVAVAAEEARDLALSIDVLFHLVEDPLFDAYLDRLFGTAGRFVVIYSSNCDLAWPAPHVRHRRFTERIARRFPAWRLAAHVPNPFPFEPGLAETTSFADFFVYCRRGTSCVVELPAEAC